MSDLTARIERARQHIRAGTATPAYLMRLLDDMEAGLEGRTDGNAEVTLAALTITQHSFAIAALRQVAATGNGTIDCKTLTLAVGCSHVVAGQTLDHLEAAGLIERRSRGRAGTYIRVLNPALLAIARRAG